MLTTCWHILATALPARATSIAIANSSFESPATTGATYGPVDDWVIAGPGIGGVWNISNNLGGWAQTGFDKSARSYTVPDGGFTASLLGVAMIGLGLIRRALA